MSNFFIKSRNKGFSLIETVVYISLFTLVFVIIFRTVVSTMNTFNQLRLSRDVNDTSVKVLERMTRDIENSSSINLSNSTFGSDPGKITLNVLTASGTASTIEYSVSSNELHVKENGVDLGSLMSGRSRVDGLVFYSGLSGQVRYIKIELHVNGKSGPIKVLESFYDTAILRGTY